MMRRTFKTMGIAVLLGMLFVFLGAGGVGATDKTVELKFALIMPTSHVAYPLMEQLAKKMEEASGGQYKIELFPFGALGGQTEMYDMAKVGLSDLSVMCCTFHPGEFPLSSLMELPLSSATSVEGTTILLDIVDQGLLDKEYGDVHLCVPLSTSPNQVFSNKKISKVEDFKGLRVIPASPGLAGMWKALGAQGVMMNYSDAYLALSRNTIDAGSISWAASVGWKWNEVAQYPTQINLAGGFVCPVVMNKERWEGLPKDIQDKWTQLFREYSLIIAKAYDDIEAKAKQGWAASGKTIQELPAEEMAKLGQLAAPVWEEWISKQEADGKPGKEIYKAYVQAMRKLGQPVPVKVPGLYQE